MKPFLLLSTRSVDRAAQGEYDAMLRFTGLEPGQLHRVRLDQGPMGPVDLDDWSGVILGGGPFNASDDEATKSDVQRRAEAEIAALLDEVVPADFPFLGCCYGIGTLGGHQGGVVDRTHGEPVGAMEITLTEDGRGEPLFDGVPDTFAAFLGHKEAIHTLPPGAVNLASSPTCPVQAFRVGRNVFATQFHPELDVEGIQTRIDVYRNHGYFEPDAAEELKAAAARATVTHPMRILRNFVERYAR